MAKTCISCGMPMETTEDHPDGDLTKPYCRYCARSDGSKQSYEEKVAGYAAWLVSTQNIDQMAAKHQAAAILGRLPAWSGREE